MNLPENLEQYTLYAKGDLSKKCTLQYEDICIESMDFSPYDLNNSAFLGVVFNKCNFSKVYLSGSNFGGSKMMECVLCNTINHKSNWDNMLIIRTKILGMDAFKTTFYQGKFEDTIIKASRFRKCIFSNGKLCNTVFENCNFEKTDFDGCIIENVKFEKCFFDGVKFNIEKNNSEIHFINSKKKSGEKVVEICENTDILG